MSNGTTKEFLTRKSVLFDIIAVQIFQDSIQHDSYQNDIMLMLIAISYVLSKFWNGTDIGIPERRIIGGEVCTVDDHKWIVSIAYTHFVHRCGGTLINENFVLTAAHCVIGDHQLVVIAGISHNKGYYNVTVRPISEIFIHPEFNFKKLENDIAIVKVADTIEETEYIKYITLPNSSISTEVFDICKTSLVMGWGFTLPTVKSISKDLHCVNLPIIHSMQCSYFYRRYHVNQSTIICTYSSERKDACTGDSGGPLLCNGTQLGIVSWGIGCASPFGPGVYTRVDKYLEFMHDTMRLNRSKFNFAFDGRLVICLFVLSIIFNRCFT